MGVLDSEVETFENDPEEMLESGVEEHLGAKTSESDMLCNMLVHQVPVSTWRGALVADNPENIFVSNVEQSLEVSTSETEHVELFFCGDDAVVLDEAEVLGALKTSSEAGELADSCLGG